MKKKLSVVVLICILFSLLCGCTKEVPKFLPGQHEGDKSFIWICKEPFAYFFLNDSTEKKPAAFGICLEKGNERHFFYGDYTVRTGTMGFIRSGFFEGFEEYMVFGGNSEYYESYFNLMIKHDDVNFFDGEFPTLRFEKMTKEEFRETYGEERFSLITAEGEVDEQ